MRGVTHDGRADSMCRMDDQSGFAERGFRLREVVTQRAAFGFAVGGLTGLLLDGATSLRCVLVCMLILPAGAILAAVLAGILFNLIVLPFLSRLLGRRLPQLAYRAAGTLAGVAAFASAFAHFTAPVA